MSSVPTPAFVFERITIDTKQQRLTFSYVCHLFDGTSERYVETLEVPDTTEADWQRLPRPLLESIAKQLHLALGVSYWKMYCLPEIRYENMQLSQDEAHFWETIYTKGLGEFFYRNQLDFRGLVRFPWQAGATATPTSLPASNRVLAPVGGGKDSVVTFELLKKQGIDFDLFSLSTSPVQSQISQIVGTSHYTIRRHLDPRLSKVDAHHPKYNGHVPITTIYHFSAVLFAALKGYGYVAFSNERSANVGNVSYLGHEINHQWSKSAEAEELIQKHIHTQVTPDITTFSLLRPLSELEIIRRFCEYPQYFSRFSSCNRNFKQQKPTSDRPGHAYWCGACPKCAFVFVGLVAFVSKETVVDIFGKNLLADHELLPLYQELLGVKDFKPFECVGTIEEMKVAFALASQKGEYNQDPVMTFFNQTILLELSDVKELEKEIFSIGDASSLPPLFKTIYAT